jgi:uncharacterized protein (DUF433 family)
MSLIGTGVYVLRQVARLIEADSASVRRWLLGYTRRGQEYAPLWRSELADVDLGEPVVGFRDLLELRLVAAFASHGVSLRTIRATADYARQEFGTAYPLTSQRFLTDGKTIFLEAVKATEDGDMLDVPRRQLVFSDIIRPSLYKGIEFEGPRARRWYPQGEGHKVVLDPEIQFGAPIVSRAGVPTDAIHAAFLANGKDRKVVARIFDLRPQEVDAAVRFESKLAA